MFPRRADYFPALLMESTTLEAGDTLLALSRRLDWRFVFEDPNLKDVVIAGSPDDELLNAVKQFSDHMVIWNGQSVDGCSMLILHNPSLWLCHRALEALQPARLYIEFEGNSISVRLKQVLSKAGCVFIARRGPYDQIRIYWHWPDIANANRIIPLPPSEPLSFVLASRNSGVRKWLATAGLHLLRRLGLLIWIIKGMSVAAERRA